MENARQCSQEIESLVIHLVNQDFDASLNLTAKHVGMITGQAVSANLIKGVRARNGLVKQVKKKSVSAHIRTRFDHVISIDVVRERGEKIFGMIRDKTKLVYHRLAKAHSAEEALKALQSYIHLYGKPDAVRSDHGSEFKGIFSRFLKKRAIAHLRPLPYNPGANGFIERYFRTLRKALFRKLQVKGFTIRQSDLDDFAFLWNHCRQVTGKKGKTPAELSGVNFPGELSERFCIKLRTIGSWTFWHIKGVQGILHAYLREEMLPAECCKAVLS